MTKEERRTLKMDKIQNAIDDFLFDADAITEAILARESYSVEIMPSGSWRMLRSNELGNLYETPGFIVQLPSLDREEYDPESELYYFDKALEEAFKALVVRIINADEAFVERINRRGETK